MLAQAGTAGDAQTKLHQLNHFGIALMDKEETYMGLGGLRISWLGYNVMGLCVLESSRASFHSPGRGCVSWPSRGCFHCGSCSAYTSGSGQSRTPSGQSVGLRACEYLHAHQDASAASGTPFPSHRGKWLKMFPRRGDTHVGPGWNSWRRASCTS
jgi:hypothetical protein